MRITGGTLRGRSIKTGQGPGYRPAQAKVRQAVFSMLEARGLNFEGANVLDVFAGSGSLALEALSRGAGRAWFVESSGPAARIIAENLAALGIPAGRTRILRQDACKALETGPDAPFDLAFLDPPYGQGLLAPALERLLSRPWLADGAFVLAEVESGLALDEGVWRNRMTLAADRLYGQTRILLWRLN